MNTRMLALLTVSLALAGTLALAQEKPQGAKLTGAELTQLTTPYVMLVGLSTVFHSTSASAYLRGGNFLQVVIEPDGHGFQTIGTWRVSGDSLCNKLLPPSPTGEICRSIHKLNDGSYEARSIPEGWLFAVLRVVRPD